jgi:hypothetical protein
MGEMRNAFTILVANSGGKRPFGMGIDRRIILEGFWIGFLWLRIVTDGGLL